MNVSRVERVQGSSVDCQILPLVVKTVEMGRLMGRCQKRVVRRESLERRRRSRVTVMGQGRSAMQELLLLDDLMRRSEDGILPADEEVSVGRRRQERRRLRRWRRGMQH